MCGFYQLLNVPYEDIIVSTAASSRVWHMPQLMVYSGIHVHNSWAFLPKIKVLKVSNNSGFHCQRLNVKKKKGEFIFHRRIGQKRGINQNSFNTSSNTS